MSNPANGARATAATILGQGAGIGLKFVATIVLSRLLTPDDFGLVAMMAVIVSVGMLIQDLGLPSVALQARQLTEQQAANLFWVTAFVSLLVSVGMAAATPVIAAVYDEPRLQAVAPAMCLALFLNGLYAHYQVRLSRAMRFGALVVLNLAAVAAGIVAAVALAAAGWGYWALVMQTIFTALVTLVGAVGLSRWLPMRPRRGSGSRALMRDGRNIGGASLLSFAAENADTVIIGARFGAVPLGYYNRAFQLFMAPTGAVFSPLVRVVIPLANRARSEQRSPSRVLLRVQFGACGLAIALLTSSAALAPSLVPLLLGPGWTEVVPLLQILAIGGVFRALSQTNYWAYLVEAESRELLLSNLITKPLQIALIVAGSFFGVAGVAWAYAIGRALTWPFNLWWLLRVGPDYSKAFLLNGLRLIGAGLGAFLVAKCAASLMAFDEFPTVLVGAIVHALVFLIILGLLPSSRRELIALVTGVLRRA